MLEVIRDQDTRENSLHIRVSNPNRRIEHGILLDHNQTMTSMLEYH